MARMLALNLIALILAISPTADYAQTPEQNWSWREYQYVEDGFAATFPYQPRPHHDKLNPNFMDYSIRLSADAYLTLRTVADTRPCSDTLNLIRSKAAETKVPATDLTGQGYKALEIQHQVGSETMKFERYLCTGARYYIFSVQWPTADGTRLPASASIVLKSFHLLSPGR